MADLTILSNEELIAGCVKGERQAQSQLYNRFKHKMFMVCLRYSNSREEAEEILQEGFIKVFRFINQYQNTGSFEGWIRKIMVNCALQKFRSRKLHPVVNIDTSEIEISDKDEIISRLGTKELLNLVQQLSPSYRMVFNLYVFEGMKHREIAEYLGISEGTSKSNLSDARNILQSKVKAALRSVNQNAAPLAS